VDEILAAPVQKTKINGHRNQLRVQRNISNPQTSAVVAVARSAHFAYVLTSTELVLFQFFVKNFPAFLKN
jgi:hypothetical protein